MEMGKLSIDASAMTSGSLTAVAGAKSITAADTIKGGAGTSDVLKLTADNDSTGAVTTLMVGVETIQVVASATPTDDIVITMGANDTQIGAGKKLTVDATALTNSGATLTFVGTASELDGNLSITGGAGSDTITGANAADTINGGAGLDVITGGSGADSLTGGNGADTFIYSAVAQSAGSGVDTITDFTSGSDKLQLTLDYSSTNSSTNLIINATKLTAATGLTDVLASLSGERGQYIYDTTNSKLYVNVNNDNLLTSTDYTFAMTAAATAANTVVDGDVNFIVTGGAGADTITLGGGADTISGGLGVDAITGGLGADSITGGAGADSIILTESTASADRLVVLNADTGSVLSSSAAAAGHINFGAALNAAQAFSTTALDIVTGFAAGDTIQIYSTGTTAIAFATTVVTNGGTFTDSTGQLGLIKGNYVGGATNTFTASTTGTDTALIYDTDGTNTSGALNAIILVGYVDANTPDTINATSGLFTAVA
jgi:Ca2+-binding RTX toxin-like protein